MPNDNVKIKLNGYDVIIRSRLIEDLYNFFKLKYFHYSEEEIRNRIMLK